jgi:thiosulfate dehydrogenase [quinone] large subunit
VSERGGRTPARGANPRKARPTRRRRRVWYAAPPPKAVALSGWALLPLRGFLGFTFCFAGLQKLANPNFFNASSPVSIQAQLLASSRVSPLHQLLGHLLGLAVPIGVLIALAEIAVGLGVLLGLWTRVAAAGGMMLALTLFLTVSFHSSPYYTGADIVFLFAFIPLVLAGSGGVLSLDGLIAARVAGEDDSGPPGWVPVRFVVVQELCGHFAHDTCKAQGGRPCDPHGCPILTEHVAQRGNRAAPAEDADRRALVLGGAAVAAAAVVGGVAAGAAAGLGRLAGGTDGVGAQAVTLGPGRSPADGTSTTTTAPPATTTTSPSPAPTTTPPAGPTTTQPTGNQIGPARDVPVGGAANFTDPRSGDPSLVLQPAAGEFVAFDAVCPHAGCTVGYSPAANLIVCPCHGSEFDPRTGAVLRPPAPHGLTPIRVAVDGNGELVVDG